MQSNTIVSNSLEISRWFLMASGTRLFRYYEERIPRTGPVMVVSNHRSFMDALVLMSALGRPIRFACHHYMGQVPVLREIVKQLGCFPLDASDHRQRSFFRQAIAFLDSQQTVGIFPEGADPMVKITPADRIGEFQRGFAHLALRSQIQDLAVLPVAIAATEEMHNSAVPLRLLSLFDPSEPLFAQGGWHPMTIYRRASVIVGKPFWITPEQHQQYRGKQAKAAVTALTDYCQTEISMLLHQGCD